MLPTMHVAALRVACRLRRSMYRIHALRFEPLLPDTRGIQDDHPLR
jgi:hypothetical protein